jgi:A/G-specific adenine glycosylase
LDWYDAHGRDLPWRCHPEAYRIWIAEIMAQQTRIETVVPRYHEFLTEFPDVRALAAAPVTRVCEAWAGLGYYRRARNLHAAAVQVVSQHGGELPREVELLRSLPGIGRYTAGAIASTAFGVEAPVVDGNVVRVLSRVHAFGEPPSAAPAQRQLWAWAAELVRGERPGDLNQALMELGALVCLPRSPRCDACPLASFCAARRRGSPEQFPCKPRPAVRKQLDVAFAWLPSGSGVWLEQRPVDGLWAGLWEPPSASGRRAKARLRERLGVELGRPLATVSHQLSHRDITARLYGAERAPRWRGNDHRRRFVQPLDAPLSALARKALRAVAGVGTTGSRRKRT